MTKHFYKHQYKETWRILQQQIGGWAHSRLQQWLTQGRNIKAKPEVQQKLIAEACMCGRVRRRQEISDRWNKMSKGEGKKRQHSGKIGNSSACEFTQDLFASLVLGTPRWLDYAKVKRREWQEDEMLGWHHWFNGHELGQTLGDGEGQGSLVSHSPRDCKESDMTWWPNNKRSGLCLSLLGWGNKSSSLLPRGLSGKEPTCQCRRRRRLGFDPWVRKIS